MRFISALISPGTLLVFLLCLSSSVAVSQTSAPSPDDGHKPPVSAHINVLAHRLLDAAIKTNGLTGPNVQPWHMKAEFELSAYPGAKKPLTGTMEEWYAGEYKWRRTYVSSEEGLTGSEWSAAKLQHFESKSRHDEFFSHFLNLRVARPVTDSLYQVANINPEDILRVQRLSADGTVLNCTSLVDSSSPELGSRPEWFIPTMCFDTELHLRMIQSEETVVQFNDLQPFQGRAIPRDVKVISRGQLASEVKITLLESVPAVEDSVLKPPPDAAQVPYIIEPGYPRPKPVYEVGTTIPFLSNNQVFRGTVLIDSIIHKDGTVKVLAAAPISFFNKPVLDAVSFAVSKWRYEPYTVDGQAVEVRYNILYPIDGKPFVPSYERPAAAPASAAPGDFSRRFDPKRDPQKDLALAEEQANAAHKQILVEVGGNWCSWCWALDQLFGAHADLKELRDKKYVLLKVNMSPANENQAFLAGYPAISGYPWMFVLDANGKLVTSKNATELEDGARGYSAKAVKEFLAQFSGQ